jgi:hypothetical protein
MSRATDHKIRKESDTKGETWRQCKECGATYHGGWWWLGGYRSKVEPACNMSDAEFRPWAKLGEKVEF